MRYDDASGSFSSQGAGAPDARDDADALPAGSRGPATGNTITGEGTITGAAGADVVNNGPGKIVALEGASGSDKAQDGSFHAEGRFGDITMDSRGSYSYTPHAAKPEGGSDVFRYTLADADGSRDSATLTIDIGREIEKIEANAQQIVPGPDGVVTLPPGVQLSDILVVGRNLVINLPDGTQMVIIDGAVFVPQLVLNGVEVPASNLAALLIDAEPQPAAGTPLSSGGNFAVDVPPLDPGVPLGDLIPPTELVFEPPIFEEVGQFDDEEPEIFIQPDGQPAAIAAVDDVHEAGLPARPVNEPAGSGESADGNSTDNDDARETTTGVILIDSPDDPSEVTINGVVVTGVIGQVIAGAHGTLTITSFSDTQIGYRYTLTDNTSGDATHDDFTVTVTDNDGDEATATLTINIVDDVPTARPDTDSIAPGTFGPATGNVITDAAAGDIGDSDTNAADTVGADNATLTSVSGFGGSDSTFSGGVLQVNGQYGVLTIEPDGDYSYVRNPNTPGGVNDVFNYTITDGDGDTSSSTLTISIGDRGVTVGPNAVVRTDDDAVPGAGGNAGGTGDDVDAENLTGTLSGSGGDGTLTFDLLTTGAPAGFTYVDGPGGSVLVQQGGVTVLTITVNAATGAYTVTQNAPIDHPAGGDENNLEFPISYTVTDLDGDSATGTLTINVDDDTPEIDREDVGAPALTVDETDLATNATGNFSTLFSVDYGADGAGSTSYAVSVVNGTDSGLDDVATGQDILLFNNGGVVEGRVGGAAGAVAFTVSVNSTTGVVTLDQIRALEHPNASDHDDPVSPNATSIQFTVNAVDGDGDPVSQTVNIGGNLVFEDDGPSLTNVQSGAGVLLDETTAGTPAGFPISATSASAVVTATASFGADGAGSLVYGLALAGGAPSVASGLQTAIGDFAITLVQIDADTIQGQYNGTNVAFTIQMNADGTITVTQNVPLEHLVDGPPGPAHDDPLDLNDLVTATVTITDRDGDTATAGASIGNGIVFEDDGPSIDVTAGAEAGVLLTTDDAQTIGGASDTASTTANFSGVFGLTFAGGADGAAGSPTLGYTLGVSVQGVNSGLTQTGAPIYLYVIGGEVVGSTSATEAGVNAGNTVFDVSVDASGEVTLTQFSQIDHPIGTDPTATGAPFADHIASLADGLVTLTASSTITDNDGDFATDSATVNIGANLRFTDDGPSLTDVRAGSGVTLDETTAGSPAGFPISGTSGAAVISATQAFGADGPGSVVYGLSLISAVSGLQTAIGDFPITLVQIDADTIQGQYNGTNVAFTVQMNADGTVTLTQNVPLEHLVDGSSAAAHDDSLDLGGLINATVTITDFDGDTATASAEIGDNLVFEDDGPDAQVDGQAAPDILVLDETRPLGTETDGDSNPAGLDTVQANFANNFVTPADHGADGPGTVTYSLVLDGTNVASGLYALDPTDTTAGDGDGIGRGSQIVLNQSGNTVTGSVGLVNYFTISIDPATGIVTFTQLQPIWHGNTASDDDTSTLTAATGSLLVRQTVTDSDGDFDTADIDVSTGRFQIEDDGPVAVNDTDTVGAPGTTATGNVITDAHPGDAGDTDTGADDVGADVPGRITAIASNNVPANTDTTFSAGLLQVQGAFGVLTINAAGDYTYTRDIGSPGGGTDTFTYTLMDADGDTTTATLAIAIADNRPIAGSASATVDDDGLAGGNPASTTGDLNANVGETTPSASEAIYNGTLGGTAGDGATVFLFSSALNGTTATVGTEMVTYTVSGGGTMLTATGPRGVLFTVQITNQTTGEYTVTLVDNVLHPTLDGVAGDNTENDSSVVIPYQMQDADGDLSLLPGSLTITFDDDMPSAAVDTDTVGAPGSTATGNVITDAAAGDAGDTDTGADAVGADTPGTITALSSNNVPASSDTDATANFSLVGQFGTLTMDTAGNYVYTRAAGTPGGGNDVFTYTLTDADGDSVTSTLTIAIADIRPIAGASTATVDDEGLANGITGGTGDLNANVGETTPSASEAIFNGTLAGTAGDGATTFLFSASQTGTTAVIGQETVTYTVSGGGTLLTANITASPDATRIGDPLFTVQITNTTTGAYTVTLVDNVLHDTLNGVAGDDTENDASAVIPFQMQDADGDQSLVAGSLTITFDDDMPQAIQPVDITTGLENEVGATETADLDNDGEVIADFGADGPGLVTFANITQNVPIGLTSGGDAIEYFLKNNDQTLEGRTNSTNGIDGELVFTVQINQATGDYTFTLADTIDNGAGVFFSDLSGGVAGNPPFKLIQSSTPDGIELLATPINAGSVNSDSDDIAVDSQFIDIGNPDIGIRFDFGDFTYHPNGGGTSDDAFVIEDHTTVNGFRFTIDQISGGTTADIRLKAIDADDDGGLEEQDVNPAGDATDPITMVRVYDTSGVLVATFTGDGTQAGITADFEAGGTVLLTQLPSDYSIQTFTADGYNRIEITNAGIPSTTDGKFSLSLLQIQSVDSGDPITLGYDLNITDADGDTVLVTDAIDITIAPANAATTEAQKELVSKESISDSSETSAFSMMSSDSLDNHRTMSAANNNSVLLGAIAAAGLGMGSAAAAQGFGPGGNHVLLDTLSLDYGAAATQGFAIDHRSMVRDGLANETQEILRAEEYANPSSSQRAIVDKLSLTDSGGDQGQAPAAFLQATEMQHSDLAQSTLTSASVGMPSAEMLAGTIAGQAGFAGETRGTAEVGRVLADALAGGGNGPGIEAVIQAVSNQNGGSNPALDALATHGALDVSAWHMGAFSGFTAGSASIMLEPMQHPDAVAAA